MLHSLSKTDYLIKVIKSRSEAADFIKEMLNLLNKTDDFIKNDKFTK